MAVGPASGALRPLRNRLTVSSSHIVLTEPVPDVVEAIGWTGGEAISDGRTLLHYLRTTPDGRILFGWAGGRMAMGARTGGRMEVDPDVIGRAKADLVRFFPALAGRAVERAWGGPIDVSPTHMPFVTTLPGGRAHAAFGYTGNGVGPTHVAAKALAALALGRTDGAAALPIVGPPPKVPPEPLPRPRRGGHPPRPRRQGGGRAGRTDAEPRRADARGGPGAHGHAHRALSRGHIRATGAAPPPRILEWQMTLADRVKQDLTSAMKAGEKDRVGALRLVLSELQKDAKEGAGDELAVLRRERKRRHESATAFRDGGRADRAAAEEAEAEIIEAYLPAELSDEELRAIVADAVAETGAASPKDMGQVMKAAMPRVAGRADGKRVSALAQEALRA